MKKSSKYKLRRIGDKAMIVAIDRNRANLAQVYTLNQTAAAIWDRLGEGEIDVEATAQWICDEFDTDYDTAVADLRRTIEEWSEYGLVY